MLSQLTVLSSSAIAAIHESTLDLLRDVGIHFPDAETLDVLARAGADVNRASPVDSSSCPAPDSLPGLTMTAGRAANPPLRTLAPRRL